jgi:hypothetical protein
VENAVRAPADGLRQDVRPAFRADERGRRREDPEDLVVDVGVARSKPPAVLDRDRLVKPPCLLEVLAILERHPRVVGEPRSGAAGGGKKNHVDDDRDTEQDGDRLDHPPDDVLRHGATTCCIEGFVVP